MKPASIPVITQVNNSVRLLLVFFDGSKYYSPLRLLLDYIKYRYVYFEGTYALYDIPELE
jgi:hypothetical protein